MGQQSAAENSQQSADQHDVVVELQHFVTASAESTTAAQIILNERNNTGSTANNENNISDKRSPLGRIFRSHQYPVRRIQPTPLNLRIHEKFKKNNIFEEGFGCFPARIFFQETPKLRNTKFHHVLPSQ